MGWLSDVLSEAGERAGEVLAQIDTAPLGTVIVVRDETFFQGLPLLLVIDPVSTTILQAVVAPDRQAETWGIVLLMVEEQGAKLGGVVEDLARMYPASLAEADLTLDVQKDVWHIEREGAQLLLDLERAALRATRQVLAVEKQLRKNWDGALFAEQYIPAVAQEERLYAQHAAFANWLGHLCDVLEVVDWRSGEIRNRTINGWLLTETLQALDAIAHPAVTQWVATLRRYQAQLLTYLDWLAAALAPYEMALAQQLTCPQVRTQFMRQVARHWRLRQMVVNGQAHFRSAAQAAQAALHLALGHCAPVAQFSERLLTLLDATCRASSLIENINGLLKQFLRQRKAFPSPQALQRYLNLFTLWHNLRIYQRGKRQGQSPYQRAGIHTASPDWLTLLGYPPA